MKVKTRKSVTKRYKVTSKGKILRGRSFTSHLRVKKTSKHKRRLSGTVVVKGVFARKLAKVLGIKKK